MPDRTQIGDIELMPVLDAIGELGELGELYPDTPPEEWEPYRELYPDLFAGTRWRVPGTSYLLRTSDTTILVDTGVGPPGLWDWGAEKEGLLPEGLSSFEVSREEVAVVFLTHMHIDHVGWNTDLDGVQFFPRARYVVHHDSLAFARTHDDRPHVRRCILPLADRFETVAQDVELAPGVTAFVAPGHYPGHMALRLDSGGDRAVLLADTAVHPALLDRPDWIYVSDGDPAVCAATRRALLPELVDRDIIVVCGHYPRGGIGRIVRKEGVVVWEAA